MVKSKTSKCVKPSKSNRSRNGIDRISELSDPLISQILSFLPTKEAVATSVLSTRWKFLWAFIINLDLDIDCYTCNYYSRETRKMRKKLRTKRERREKRKMRVKLKTKREKLDFFLNRVLIQLNHPSIHNIRLNVCCESCYDDSCLNLWVSAGFKRAFHKFTLSLNWGQDYETFSLVSPIDCNVAILELIGMGIYFKIPAAASLCYPSLRVLQLTDMSFEIPSNSSVSFPNLKIMHLTRVMFTDDDSAYKLLSSSPVLDDLTIDTLEWVSIRIPSLTRLSIEFNDIFGKGEVRIDCRALEHLDLFYNFPCEHLTVENLSSLVRAKVDILFCDEDDVNGERCSSTIKFLQSLSNVKFLSVSNGVLKALKTASTNITLGFHNLMRLEIHLRDCVDLCVMINSLLERMDNLEHLIMEGSELSRSNCSHHSWWTKPANVPECLLSRVTTVSFSDMNVDCCDQLELIRYFLKEAQVLRLLTISINHISKKKHLNLVKKISLMPKGSSACQVAFT